MRTCSTAAACCVIAAMSYVPVSAQQTKGAPSVGQKVLRHAVFFKFKDSASEPDVNAVVDTFLSLEDSIPEIVGMEYGVNNSPEGLDDGFTHCFLVTFADQAALQRYVAHDGHTRLVKQALPLSGDLFAIDYHGVQDRPEKRVLRHAVFFRFQEQATAAEIDKVVKAFEALPSKIDAIKGFEWGTSLSPGRSAAGFTHCFLLTFDSEAGRAEYLPHPDHKEFGNLLRPILAQVRVLDYWSGE